MIVLVWVKQSEPDFTPHLLNSTSLKWEFEILTDKNDDCMARRFFFSGSPGQVGSSETGFTATSLWRLLLQTWLPSTLEGLLLHLSGLGESGGGGSRLPGAGPMVVVPAIHAPAASIHEEVADGAEFQAKLLGDGDLHFLGRAFVFLKDGDECATLQVRED